MRTLKSNRSLVMVSSIYLIFIFSRGTQNTKYFEEWISGLVHGNFFSLYHVVPNQGVMQTDNLTVPYPPFSLYLLGIVAKILIFFCGEFHNVYLITSNLTSVLFTLATVVLLATWGKIRGNLSPRIYLLTPTVFLLSPILGYQDSIMSFFILFSLIMAEKNKFFTAGSFASFAVFSKQLAVMPMFGLGLLILLSLQHRNIIKFLSSFTLTTFFILLPFITTGTLPAYFHSQALASVHTMLSAKDPNFPWLFSLVIRIKEKGLFNPESFSANPYQLFNQPLRQAVYLSFGFLTVTLICCYILFWSNKIGIKSISPLFCGAISISTYNLFSCGVHENHVFMLIPVLFAISHSRRSKQIYFVVSVSLGLNLLATGGLGFSFAWFPILAATNGVGYSAIGLICLAGYSWAFLEVLRTEPLKVQLPENATA